MDDRDLCVRHDVEVMRNGKRVSIICNLILQLWIEDRLNDLSKGFFYEINKIELSARKDFEEGKAIDPFYWEEDLWYDKLVELIEYNKTLDKNNSIEDIKDIDGMKRLMEAFKGYWSLYPDLRLQQIIESFKESFYHRLTDATMLDAKFWEGFLIGEQFKAIQNSIDLALKKIHEIQEENSIMDDDWNEKYLSTLNRIVDTYKEEMNNLKEKYNDFKL